MAYGGTIFIPFSQQLRLMSKEQVADIKHTHGGANAITFGVYKATNLCQVAIPLGNKFNGCWLH